MQISILDIPPIFAPFTREYALTRSTGRQRTDSFAEKWQAGCFVQPRAFTFTGREELVE